MGSAGLKVNEPSMEDILASIRRIIADDQEEPKVSEPEASASSPLKNVLDIAERHVSPLLGAGPNEPVLGPWNRGEMGLREGLPEDEPVESPPPAPEPAVAVLDPASKSQTPQPVTESAPAEALLSREAGASVADAFGRLGASMRSSQPLTVEDLMKEMLRPMLKAWLDDNLPSLVERLVRDEIERVARRRA